MIADKHIRVGDAQFFKTVPNPVIGASGCKMVGAASFLGFFLRNDVFEYGGCLIHNGCVGKGSFQDKYTGPIEQIVGELRFQRLAPCNLIEAISQRITIIDRYILGNFCCQGHIAITQLPVDQIFKLRNRHGKTS